MGDNKKRTSKNSGPSVTIAIPTYNRSDDYLRQTLKSALDQTYTNLEIIVSDNHSTDNTRDYINSFSDNRLNYIRQKKNIPANDNFNFCLEQAKGDYFLLLHDDDVIDPDFIQICMDHIDHNTDVGIIRTGTRVIDDKGSLLQEEPNKDEGLSFEVFLLKWLSWENSIYLCSTLFNTKKLKEFGGFQSKHNLFQDALAEFNLSFKFGRLDIDQVKASFRKHGEANTAKSKIEKWCEDSLFLLNEICEFPNLNKRLIRTEGLKYFSKFNYELAKNIQSPVNRFFAYSIIFKYFNIVFLIQISAQLFRASPLYLPLRNIKKWICSFN